MSIQVYNTDGGWGGGAYNVDMGGGGQRGRKMTDKRF